jgi:hypothetical protein
VVSRGPGTPTNPTCHGRGGFGDNLRMAKKRAHRPEGYPGPAARQQPATPRPPASRGRPTSAQRSPARRRFEELSAPALVRMQMLPGWLIPALLGLMLFVGLAVPARWAGILLVIIGVFLAWLTAVSWPVISPGSRALRAAVNLAVLAFGVGKLAGAI